MNAFVCTSKLPLDMTQVCSDVQLVPFTLILNIPKQKKDVLVSGVEDNEKIVDFPKESGEFQARINTLASMVNGKVKIDVEESIIGEMAILMGGTNNFEHYLLNHKEGNFTVPYGNFFKDTCTQETKLKG